MTKREFWLKKCREALYKAAISNQEYTPYWYEKAEQYAIAYREVK